MAQCGGEASVDVLICGLDSLAVEEGGVALVQCVAREPCRGVLVQELCEVCGDGMEQFLALHLAPEDLAERYGVGGIAEEGRLVHVEPYADDASGQAAPLDVVLDEDAAQLMVSVVNVVGPLDADVWSICREHFADGYGDNFAENKLLAGSNVARRQCESKE